MLSVMQAAPNCKTSVRGLFTTAAPLRFSADSFMRPSNGDLSRGRWNETRCERERVLADLAIALFGAGYFDLARSADRLLVATVHEPYLRWLVTINLIEIATIQRDKAEFHRLAQSLRTVVLPPILLANYHYYVGQGEAVFGRAERARQELERAVGLAEQHGLGEIIIKAEAALLRIREGQREAETYRQVPVPPEFTHITDALHGACAAALAERE